MNWRGEPLSFLPMLAGQIESLAAEPRVKETPRPEGTRIADVYLFGPLDPSYMRMKRDQLARLAADPTVRAIILTIDSPGGTVNGSTELAEIGLLGAYDGSDGSDFHPDTAELFNDATVDHLSRARPRACRRSLLRLLETSVTGEQAEAMGVVDSLILSRKALIKRFTGAGT